MKKRKVVVKAIHCGDAFYDNPFLEGGVSIIGAEIRCHDLKTWPTGELKGWSYGQVEFVKPRVSVTFHAVKIGGGLSDE